MLKLVQSSDPILRQNAEPLIDSEIQNIINISSEMFYIMNANNGVGLAAPQVGISKRFFIKKCFDVKIGITVDNRTKSFVKVNDISFDSKERENYYDLIINPVLVSKNEQTSLMAEGCLSLPMIEVQIERPISIILNCKCLFNTLFGKNFENVNFQDAFNDIEARICLHEMDHLDGKLIIDYY
jgi:peptide deformylase